MSERSEAEWLKIENPGFLGSLRDKGAEITNALRTLGVELDDLRLTHWEVPVHISTPPGGREFVVQAGLEDDGSPIFEWTFPAAYFQPYEWWQDRQPDGNGG